MSLVFVSGCPRSGTSYTTSVMGACGAMLGKVNDLYEHILIKDRCVKTILQSVGADPEGQDPLPSEEDLSEAAIKDCIMKWKGNADCIKEVKFLLLWPVLVRDFPDVKWIICRRNTNAIIASLSHARIPYKNKLGRDEDFLRKYVNAYVSRIEALKVSGARFVEVWPGESFNSDKGPFVFKEAVGFAGFQWNEMLVRQKMDIRRWHH